MVQERVPRKGPVGMMAAGHGYPVAGGEQGKVRATDVDRDRVAGILGTAYSEGRLSRDEYDARLQSALSARTYADLDHVVIDLPTAQAAGPSPAAPAMVATSARTNGLEDSYGRRNRQAIAARETRVATRLRAVQHAYQMVAGHDTVHTARARPDIPFSRASGRQGARAK